MPRLAWAFSAGDVGEMNYPPCVYLAKVCGEIIGVRRHGHWQSGSDAGKIRTPEALPIEHDGKIYRCEYPSDRQPGEICYTLHATSAPDHVIEEVTGFKIEDMTGIE